MMQRELRGPRGNVIQQNLKWGHVVSEVSLGHPSSMFSDIYLKKNPDSFDFDKNTR